MECLNKNWAEEYAETFKEKTGLNSIEVEDFKGFVESRAIAGKLGSWQIYAICKQVLDHLYRNEGDAFTLVTGAEGVGKSTIAKQIAAITCGKDVTLINHINHYKDYLYKRALRMEEALINNTRLEPSAVIIDEGAFNIYAREYGSYTNREFTKLFQGQRYLNLHVIICIPRYTDIDEYVRVHRAKYCYVVLARKENSAYIKIISKRALDIINDKIAHKKKVLLATTPIPIGSFTYAESYKVMPFLASYKDYEIEKNRKFIEHLGIDRNSFSKENSLTINELAQRMGVSYQTVFRTIKKLNIKKYYFGKKIYVQIADWDAGIKKENIYSENGESDGK